MSVELTTPYGDAVIEVSDDLVDRYVDAGYVKASAPAKKAPARKTSASADEK
ncbi:MAG: hypothetical protein P1U38_09625 [Aeromicrobium sp.]|uniref:DUF7302 family protein n=1 Tax=Aeromicrobium sp. TaxID=1871063 RepID=UPI0026089238|nr:hypothetical protein [Aeromicrobium sp.]MDF1705020.1 hypothetical protein [Aeromicrobium sp.]